MTLSVSQAVALENILLVIAVPAGDTVTISDTQAAIKQLTGQQLAALPSIGVTGFAGSTTLSVAQAVALETAANGKPLKLKVPSGDTLTISDTSPTSRQ